MILLVFVYMVYTWFALSCPAILIPGQWIWKKAWGLRTSLSSRSLHSSEIKRSSLVSREYSSLYREYRESIILYYGI